MVHKKYGKIIDCHEEGGWFCEYIYVLAAYLVNVIVQVAEI